MKSLLQDLSHHKMKIVFLLLMCSRFHTSTNNSYLFFFFFYIISFSPSTKTSHPACNFRLESIKVSEPIQRLCEGENYWKNRGNGTLSRQSVLAHVFAHLSWETRIPFKQNLITWQQKLHSSIALISSPKEERNWRNGVARVLWRSENCWPKLYCLMILKAHTRYRCRTAHLGCTANLHMLYQHFAPPCCVNSDVHEIILDVFISSLIGRLGSTILEKIDGDRIEICFVVLKDRDVYVCTIWGHVNKEMFLVIFFSYIRVESHQEIWG